MENEKIKLTFGLVNAILQYLGNRPYSEVFQLIQTIQKQASEQEAAQESADSQV